MSKESIGNQNESENGNGNKRTSRLREANPFSFKCVEAKSAASALSKMAKKKAPEVLQLQIEVETELQWKNLLRREGLIVVDVYSAWTGPTISMISLLKKVKSETNDDRLQLAIACSDKISDLSHFRDQSEPTWLFIGGGKPVKLLRGTHPAKIIHAIESEFQHEVLCMQGKARRNLISIEDHVNRRNKGLASAMQLSAMQRKEIEEKANVESDHEAEVEPVELSEAESIERTELEESNNSMKSALLCYTVLVIQTFLLETGAVTEIREALIGEFKFDQERTVSLSEETVRQLFNIPTAIPDPDEPEEEEEERVEEKDDEESGEKEGDALTTDGEPGSKESSPGPLPISPQPHVSASPEKENKVNEHGEGEDVENPEGENGEEESEPEVKPKKRQRKLIPLDVPEEIVGDTLIILLESVELKKLIDNEQKPESEGGFQTADDYIQVKVGPDNYEIALEEAPNSLLAVYGRGYYEPGVWCPRKYEDKKYVMINFFPKFVTEMLTPPPIPEPKYMIAVFPEEIAYDLLDNDELLIHKKDVLAEDRIRIPPAISTQMLKSWHIEGEEYLIRKKALNRQVFVLSIDERNQDLKRFLQSLNPLHMSIDNDFGKEETAKLFKHLNISIDDSQDTIMLEKILSRMKRPNSSDEELVSQLGLDDNLNPSISTADSEKLKELSDDIAIASVLVKTAQKSIEKSSTPVPLPDAVGFLGDEAGSLNSDGEAIENQDPFLKAVQDKKAARMAFAKLLEEKITGVESRSPDRIESDNGANQFVESEGEL